MPAALPALPLWAENCEFILRVASRYGALFLLALHIPFALVIGSQYWLNTVLPSAALTCLHFAMPLILPRFGPLVGSVWLVTVGMIQASWGVIWTGEQAGMQYYFFAISALAIYLFYGYRRLWSTIFALLPMVLFAVVMLAVPSDGLVVHIDPAVARWFAPIIGLGAFALVITIGIMFSQITANAERLLALEKDRSERLLLNILPESVATRLKGGAEKVIADRIDEVSVMFADLVGFTSYARDREPIVVVGMLNTLFSRFDARVDALGLEKIKTIGDAYMVVAGAPNRRADHLEALATLALDLVGEVRDFRDDAGGRFAIRVGLHVGPVVTGVIGTHKMAYDVWGDTVNTASRLEASGLPGRIHVSADVMSRLRDRFRFEHRGVTEIRGVGAMTTYFLLAREDRP